MRFYSWKTWEGVGDLVAEPRWLAWDPDASMAALAYSDAVVLCRAQPTFSAIASLSIQVSISLGPPGFALRSVVPSCRHLQHCMEGSAILWAISCQIRCPAA